MTLYSDPPSLREFKFDKPTLLVCWWATSFCTIIILLRLAGRFIRTERLFKEDRIAALALIPLYLRMGCVHYILLYGTNNADFSGVKLSDEQLKQKRIASGLVLASRVFYAATLWILKNTILEFLIRLTGATWERSWQTSLRAIRWILVVTFIAVVISDLAECQPFKHYWQVLPDPGAQCRQGYVQLITMAVCNVFTDLLLVFFPIPIIVTSQMTIKRKIQLVLLFSLSLSIVGVTLYRVPNIIRDNGRQQYRSLLASVELLFATASANSLVLGSFMRDRGVKKQKFRRQSVAESFDRVSNPLRRPTLHRHWGSDEDLVRDLGMTVDPELRDQQDSDEGVVQYGPAPVVKQLGDDMEAWRFPQRHRSNAERSDDSLLAHDPLSQTRSESTSNQRKVSFFDVGGLLDGPRESNGSYRPASYTSSKSGSAHALPSPSLPASTGGFRRGSTALLQDLGGLLGPLNTKQGRSKSKSNGTELQTIIQGQSEPAYNVHGKPEQELMDPGGLLK
ncbi:Fc.00g090590.m01.CDS01 [Cosmosporella sp. VM-42]